MSERQADGDLPITAALGATGKSLEALWSHFVFAGGATTPRRILFTSPDVGAGTTTVATCVALGLARNVGETVALIEADRYSPGVAGYLGLTPGPGLIEVVDRKATVAEAIRNARVEGLYVVSAGASRLPREGDLGSAEARALLLHVQKQYSYCVIDAPAILEYAETRLLLQYVDVAVLVLRADSTTRQRAAAAARLIEEAGVPVLGTVLNRFRAPLPFGIGSKAPQ